MSMLSSWRSMLPSLRYALMGKGFLLPLMLFPGRQRRCDSADWGALVQACDLVPIVEPEILIDGDYDIHRSSSVSQEVFQVRQGCMPRANSTRPLLAL